MFGAQLPFRYALRSLRRSPAFLVASSLTLALGVGAAAAIFTIVNAVLLRPLPYPSSEQLVAFGHAAPGVGMGEVGQSLGTFLTYKKLTHSFSSAGLWTTQSASVSDPAGTTTSERLRLALVTPGVWSVLQSPPLAGRTFTEEDGRPGGAPIVVLSEEFVRRRYADRRSLVGQSIRLDGRDYQVVGIMPAAFHFPDARVQVWMPLRLDEQATMAGGFNYSGIARLRSGVAVKAAQADIARALPRVPELFPLLAPGMTMASVLANARVVPTVRPLRTDVIGAFGQVLWVVAATAGLVLLVACANFANLLVVRAEGRQKELAIRAALGAGQSTVIGHYLAETLLLAAAGAVFGSVFAMLGVRALRIFGPSDFPRLAEIRIDGIVLVFAVLISVFSALLATLVPIWRQGRVKVGLMLREGGRTGTIGRERHRVRNTLVAAQVALAMVLLAGSGLLVRSVLRLREVRPGFDSAHVLALQVELPRSKYPRTADVIGFQRELVSRLRAIPGVEEAGVTTKLPLVADGSNLNPLWREDQPPKPNELPPILTFIRASDGYFKALGIPVIAGRLFDSFTAAQTPFDVVVSRRYAMEQWGDSTGQRALGRRVTGLNGGVYTVVGVVETVRDSSLAAPPGSQVYFPMVPAADSGKDSDMIWQQAFAIAVRTTGDPLAVAQPVRRLFAELDVTLPIYNVRPMQDMVSASYARLSFTLFVLAVAAGVTLILGAVGLYGVVAYVVSQRTKEIGVRIALGAPPSTVGRDVVRQGIVLALSGSAVGLLLFLAIAKGLSAFLFGVGATDPLTLVVVAGTLVCVAALASYVPARRAATVDPVIAMRSDG